MMWLVLIARSRFIGRSGPGPIQDHSEVYVTPVPMDTIDASMLTIVRLDTTIKPLAVNTHDKIDPEAEHYVLLVEDWDTESSGSIESPVLRKLKPNRYDTAMFGGMYVFRLSDGGRSVIRGDSGSPVFNDKMEVVGLVSRVTDTGELLVTTISSFAPHISNIVDNRIAALQSQLTMLAAVNEGLKDRIRKLEENLLPSGAVVAFNANDCPVGWKAYERAAGRSIIGVGTGNGLTPRTLGQMGGVERTRLRTEEMPAHIHVIPALGYSGPRISANVVQAVSGGNGWHNRRTEGAGLGESHENMSPFVALLFCEKLR